MLRPPGVVPNWCGPVTAAPLWAWGGGTTGAYPGRPRTDHSTGTKGLTQGPLPTAPGHRLGGTNRNFERSNGCYSHKEELIKKAWSLCRLSAAAVGPQEPMGRSLLAIKVLTADPLALAT